MTRAFFMQKHSVIFYLRWAFLLEDCQRVLRHCRPEEICRIRLLSFYFLLYCSLQYCLQKA